MTVDFYDEDDLWLTHQAYEFHLQGMKALELEYGGIFMDAWSEFDEYDEYDKGCMCDVCDDCNPLDFSGLKNQNIDTAFHARAEYRRAVHKAHHSSSASLRTVVRRTDGGKMKRSSHITQPFARYKSTRRINERSKGKYLRPVSRMDRSLRTVQLEQV